MTEVALDHSDGVLAIRGDQSDWTDDQRTALVFLFGEKQPSRTEARMFLHVAQRVGLDPFAKQIYLVPFKGRWQVLTGIDGFRTIAARTGQVEGTVGPFWCGPDGEWRDVWLEDKPPAAAKVGVLRAGFREPAWGVASWREFAKTGPGSDQWQTRPAHMIAKVAESHAWRKAFPQDLSGLFTDDEMAREERSEAVESVEHSHDGQVHSHPRGNLQHTHAPDAVVAASPPPSSYDPVADLRLMAEKGIDDWTVHAGAGANVRKRSKVQIAADRLWDALNAGHPMVTDPRNVIDGQVVPPDGGEPRPTAEEAQAALGGEPITGDGEADPTADAIPVPSHDEAGDPVLLVDESTGVSPRSVDVVLADIADAGKVLGKSSGQLLIRWASVARKSPEAATAEDVPSLEAVLAQLMPEVEKRVAALAEGEQK